MAFALAVAMNFGAFGLLTSALAIFVSLFFLGVSHLVSGRSIARMLEQPMCKLMVAYCLFVAIYFVSYGPATWLMARTNTYVSPSPLVLNIHERLYSPVTRCIVDAPVRTIGKIGIGYLRWWLPSDVELLYRGRIINLNSNSKLKPGNSIVYTLKGA